MVKNYRTITMEHLFLLEDESNFRQSLEAVFSDLPMTDNTISAASNEVKDVLFQNNLVSEKIEQVLGSKGFDKNRIKYFIMLMESKKNELCYLALINHNSTYGDVVSNFDWNLKQVYGTSELLKLTYPILQLAFNIYNKRESKQRLFDIDRKSLDKLIHLLEEIR